MVGTDKPLYTPRAPPGDQERGAASHDANEDQQAAAEKGNEGDQTNLQTDRQREFQSFDDLFVRKTCSISPSWMPLLSACRVLPRSKDMQAFGAKVNHNILLPEIMADISNNATGNRAGIYQTPVPKLDNDLPHLLLMNLVSREKDILIYPMKNSSSTETQCQKDKHDGFLSRKFYANVMEYPHWEF